MKTSYKLTMGRVLISIWFAMMASLSALDWENKILDTGTDAGKALAIAVDLAGREHIVYEHVTASGFELRHVLRINDLTDPVITTIYRTTATEERPAHLSIDVSPYDYVFAMLVGVITKGGDVRIYERPNTSSNFQLSLSRANVANSTNKGGISVVAKGNGFSQGSFAYSAFDGSLKFCEKSGLSWPATQSVTIEANSGLAPVLIDRGKRRCIITCNDTADRIQASFYSIVTGNWGSPVTIDSIAETDFTRPDADVFEGKIGVSYEKSVTIDGTTSFLVRYAEYESSWVLKTVASSSSEELESLMSFNNQTGMRFDAAGHPMVSYQRDAFAIFTIVTLDQRLRRWIPGVGWELSIYNDPTTGYAQTHDFAVDGAGDPALLTAVDIPSADTSLQLFRPTTLPYVVELPEAVQSTVKYSFAPALATGPDGTVYLVTGAASDTGLFTARNYKRPHLFAFKGGNRVESTVIPSSDNPHVANAVAVGSDGVIHIVTLRITDITSTTGNLLYYRYKNGVLTGISLIDENGSDIDVARRAPLRLGVAGNGRLYLAYGSASGGVGFATLPPNPNLSVGSRPWETISTISGAEGTPDVSVREDGGFCLAYFRGSDRTIRSITNVNSANGMLNSSFSEELSGTLLSTETNPANVACAFGNSYSIKGIPHFAACVSPNAIKIFKRESTGARLAYNISTGEPTPNATVDLLFSNTTNKFDICYQSTRDGGSLEHVKMSSEVFFPLAEKGRVSVPRLGFSRLGGDIVSCLDGNGFPWMAYGCVESGPPLHIAFDKVLLARPADSLDRDGDGAPLLFENAFCMAKDFADAHLLPRPYRARVGESVEIGFNHRYPSVPRTSGLGSFSASQHGDFLYDMVFTEDLQIYRAPPIVSPLGSSSTTPLIPGISDTNYRYSFPYTPREPRTFLRMVVNRKR